MLGIVGFVVFSIATAWFFELFEEGEHLSLTTIILTVLILAALVGASSVADAARQTSRAKRFERYAVIRGYQYHAAQPVPDGAFTWRLGLFELDQFSRWTHTLSGHIAGAPFVAFEQEWHTRGGEDGKTHRIAAVTWEVPAVHLPLFAVTPKTLADRLKGLLGTPPGITIPEAPHYFASNYRVTGEPEEAVRALLTRSVLSGLTRSGQHTAGMGTSLLCWRKGRLPNPEGLDDFLSEAHAVCGALLQAARRHGPTSP